jgi:uncharacterized protein involved in exopolysaccharide biosynthesis
MPDLINVFVKRWKFILGLTLLSAVVGLVVTLFSPKEYLSTATALPVSSFVADKARIFNPNIEELYSDFGTADDLDKLEGTAILDTIFIAASNELELATHYGMENSGEGPYKAAMYLKKNSRINRSAYGELKVKVWDKDRNMAAEIANTLMQSIQKLHQHLQNESSVAILKAIKAGQAIKQEAFRRASDTIGKLTGADAEVWQAKKAVLLEQLQEYDKMIDQYQLAINTNPPVLLTVENARPPLWHDKPKTLLTVLLCAFIAFVFAFLLAIFTESRKQKP